MRCIVEYKKPSKKDDFPILRLYVHGAPHRRMHRAILAVYRKELYAAAKASNIKMPIDENVELNITFINPTGPDLDNLLVSAFQAMDGKCGKGPTILVDDRLICFVRAGIMFN
jgi:hypothetical protein